MPPKMAEEITESAALSKLREVKDINRLFVDVRCRKCRKLFFKWLPVQQIMFEVKCSRCGHIETRNMCGILTPDFFPERGCKKQNSGLKVGTDEEETEVSEHPSRVPSNEAIQTFGG